MKTKSRRTVLLMLVPLAVGVGVGGWFIAGKTNAMEGESRRIVPELGGAVGATERLETVAAQSPSGDLVRAASADNAKVSGGSSPVGPAMEVAAAPLVASENVALRPAADTADILVEIQDAVVKYDASVGPALEPYLIDPDSAVREAARDGLVQAGDVSGAKYLRAAADKMKDPREAVALLDAADFLELPPAPLAKGPKRPAAKVAKP